MENNSKEKYLVMDNVRNIYYGISYFEVSMESPYSSAFASKEKRFEAL